MVFTTNPYVTFHDGDSKEFIQLNKGAMIDFKASEEFDLKPSNADAFAECMDKTSKQFAYYGEIKRFPTTFAANAAGNQVLGDFKNLLETWNQIELNVVLNIANMTWGNKTFADVVPHTIEDMTNARGEVEAGVRGSLNDLGKALFLKRWRSAMMAHHCLSFLTEAAKRTIKTHIDAYEHFNETTGESAFDGPTVLALILRTMRPNVRVNVFKEIASMKDVTLSTCDNDVVEWLSQMEIKRINIDLKIPGAYSDDQFLMDVFAGALKAKCKTFTTEVQSMKQKWLLGMLPNSGRIDVTHSITQLYSNVVEDGTWRKEFSETDQIVALTTLVSQMKASIAKNTIALTTKTGQEPSNPAVPKTGNRNNRNTPYTVAAWRLEKKEESLTKDEIEWHWCTKDHYSAGIVHNGMYARHKTCDHDTWRADFDAKKAKRNPTSTTPSTTPASAPDASTKKLALSESLRTALCTQAGLSSDAADRLWSDACKESGN